MAKWLHPDGVTVNDVNPADEADVETLKANGWKPLDEVPVPAPKKSGKKSDAEKAE